LQRIVCFPTNSASGGREPTRESARRPRGRPARVRPRTAFSIVAARLAGAQDGERKRVEKLGDDKLRFPPDVPRSQQLLQRGKTLDRDCGVPVEPRRPPASALGRTIEQPGRDDQNCITLMASREGHDLVRIRALDLEWPVVALGKHFRQLLAQGQKAGREGELDPPIWPGVRQCRPIRIFGQ